MVSSDDGAATRGEASTAAAGDAVEIVHVPDAARFEIVVNGEKAGFAAYVDDDGRRIFHHTVVADRFGGRGLAGRLVGEALARTSAAGLRIVPVCSFVARYVSTHPQADGTLEPVTPVTLDIVRSATSRP